MTNDANAKPDGAGGRGAGGWAVRVAALVLVLAGVFALVPPLRTWLFDRVPGGAADGEAVVDPLSMLPSPDTLRIDSMNVRYNTLELELLADQRNGSLRIRTADAATLSAEIRTRTRLESFVDIPGGLRILNRTGSVADYEIVVPAGVRLIRVYMGGRQIEAYSPRGEGNADRTFELIDYAR